MLKKLLIKDNVILGYTGMAIIIAYVSFTDYQNGNYFWAMINAFCSGVYLGYISLRFLLVRSERNVNEFMKIIRHDAKFMAEQNKLIKCQHKLILAYRDRDKTVDDFLKKQEDEYNAKSKN